MRLLLDSHVLLWWLADDPALPDGARELIADGSNDVYVSSASVLELSIEHALGKLTMPDDLLGQVGREGFGALPVDHEDGCEAGRLPWHHRDPFDRILIAQARNKGLTVVTGDTQFPAYDVALYVL